VSFVRARVSRTERAENEIHFRASLHEFPFRGCGFTFNCERDSSRAEAG